MSFIKQDLAKYISKPILGASLIAVFDIFVQGYDIKNPLVLYDSGVMSVSILTSKLVNDLIVDTLKRNSKSIQYKLFEPVINAFLYAYGYNFILRNKYLGTYRLRSNNMNYLLAGGFSILLGYVENPLVTFFTGIKNI